MCVVVCETECVVCERVVRVVREGVCVVVCETVCMACERECVRV